MDRESHGAVAGRVAGSKLAFLRSTALRCALERSDAPFCGQQVKCWRDGNEGNVGSVRRAVGGTTIVITAAASSSADPECCTAILEALRY